MTTKAEQAERQLPILDADIQDAMKPQTSITPTRHMNPADLIQLALSKDAGIDVIERLSALFERQRAWEAEREFNEAMSAAQQEISVVVPDLTNKETGGKYASYKALNSAIRPVYLKHGFSLSFNAGESSKADEILILCDVSHKGGHTKKYLIPMPSDGKGPKGGGVMSKPQAAVAATSYGRSTLLRLIFNIAIGDDDPQMSDLSERIEFIGQFTDKSELLKYFKAAAAEAFNLNDFQAMKALTKAKNDRMEQLK